MNNIIEIVNLKKKFNISNNQHLILLENLNLKIAKNSNTSIKREKLLLSYAFEIFLLASNTLINCLYFFSSCLNWPTSLLSCESALGIDTLSISSLSWSTIDLSNLIFVSDFSYKFSSTNSTYYCGISFELIDFKILESSSA